MHWVIVEYFCSSADEMYTWGTTITLKVISLPGSSLHWYLSVINITHAHAKMPTYCHPDAESSPGCCREFHHQINVDKHTNG